MDRIKTKIIIAVTGRLRDAKDSSAKTELIEELSDNLYSRYCDFLSAGMSEDEACERALDDLGDVSELLDYLDDMEETSEQDDDHDDQRSREYLNGFIKGVENVLRETIHQTRGAVDQARILTRDFAQKMHEKYPDGVKVEYGYTKERGFYWESNHKDREDATCVQFDADAVRAIDIQLHGGDVLLTAAENEVLEARSRSDEMEIRLDESGVLTVRQGKTATASVMFGRGLTRADVEVKLPRKVWEFVRIDTASGDIDLNTQVEAAEIDLHSMSGDLTAANVCSEKMTFRTSSGDVTVTDPEGSIVAESMSGDVILSGNLRSVHASSVSGDVSVKSGLLPDVLNVRSTSGDCSVRIPDEQGFTVDLHTTTGDLTSNFALVGPMGRKSGSATYLDGGNRHFRISSTSGDISLKRI